MGIHCDLMLELPWEFIKIQMPGFYPQIFGSNFSKSGVEVKNRDFLKALMDDSNTENLLLK